MRMKTLAIILVVAIVIAAGYFALGYFRQSSTANDLEQGIASSNEQLQKLKTANLSLIAETNALKLSQEDTKSALTAENLVAASSLSSKDIIRSISNLGLKDKMSVSGTSDWTNTQIQRADYRVFKTTITLNGSEQELVDFVGALQKLYPTLVIDSIRMEAPGTTPATTTGTTGTTPATTAPSSYRATLGIAIYGK